MSGCHITVKGFSHKLLHWPNRQGMNSFMLADWDYSSACTSLHRELECSKWSEKASMFFRGVPANAELGEASDALVIFEVENVIYILD